MDKNAFVKYATGREKRSPSLKNSILAFISGGLVCLAGQGLADLYKMAGMAEKSSATLASVTLVFLAGLFTGIGCFDKAAKICGAGLLVPITGFSNAVTSPAIDAKSEGFIMGVGAEMFKIAGPVVVYGNLVAVVYGIIYYISLCIAG
ncbi:MAG: SpoVA/SpoVAEb family sporulation membrane protein [Eubacteriales bacterium]|nr:SpoVA/SpoVAEb family sporulation membrane protein [Eubacteriales bacterium]